MVGNQIQRIDRVLGFQTGRQADEGPPTRPPALGVVGWGSGCSLSRFRTRETLKGISLKGKYSAFLWSP